MKLSDEDKKNILNFFLENIAGISDVEYQKRVWIRGEGPECDDFDETVCFFFEDSDSILDNYKDFGVTDSQYHLLVKFRDVFSAFSDENDFPERFIESPEWKRITEMAKEVLAAFHYQKKS